LGTVQINTASGSIGVGIYCHCGSRTAVGRTFVGYVDLFCLRSLEALTARDFEGKERGQQWRLAVEAYPPTAE